MNTEPTKNPSADNIDAAEAIIAEAVEETVEVEVVAAPSPAPEIAPASRPSAPAVVGTGDRDDVLLSRCVFKSKVTRKSLSVHHLQRRLFELGYPDARSDKDGWYGDLTRLAVAQFQSDHSLDGDGLVDAATLTAIFDGDDNVTVVID